MMNLNFLHARFATEVCQTSVPRKRLACLFTLLHGYGVLLTKRAFLGLSSPSPIHLAALRIRQGFK